MEDITVKSILGQSSKISSDWDRKKDLYLGNQGYLSMAANFQKISKKILEISKLIQSFNSSRRNLWRFKDTIKNYFIGLPKISSSITLGKTRLVKSKNMKMTTANHRESGSVLGGRGLLSGLWCQFPVS